LCFPRAISVNYPAYQGSLSYPRQNKKLSGADAIHLFATQENFPIGIDNYGGDTNLDYKAEIDQSATDNGTWLWWSYGNGDVEARPQEPLAAPM
jgi:hypothetical protein